MPFWLVKPSMSPGMKPPTLTEAPTSTPPLFGSETVTAGSSRTGAPPPGNDTVPPAVSVGRAWISVMVVVPTLLTPALVLPSVTVQFSKRDGCAAPPVGSAPPVKP